MKLKRQDRKQIMKGANKTKSIIFLIVSILASFNVGSVLSEDSKFNSSVANKFTEIFPELEEGLDLVDQQNQLPESAWFGEDKESVQDDLNDLLDQVLEQLDIEDVAGYRQQIRESQAEIKSSQKKIAKYKREQVTAPKATTLGLNTLPGFVTKEGFQQKIDYEKDRISQNKSKIKVLQSQFQEYLESAGLKFAPDEFQLLLHTVNGEDFVDLKVTFETVKSLSTQLASLTRESGEDVATAKKYFGVYTVLLRILDRVQKNFVSDIDQKHIPKVEEYIDAANKNISQAEAGIEGGGDRFILKQNIESNKLTLRALNLYRSYLETQRQSVYELNELLQKDIITADSTYNTVSLAAQVVDLLRTGIGKFDILMSLDVPNMQGFENADIRKEIMELTSRMQEEE